MIRYTRCKTDSFHYERCESQRDGFAVRRIIFFFFLSLNARKYFLGRSSHGTQSRRKYEIRINFFFFICSTHTSETHKTVRHIGPTLNFINNICLRTYNVYSRQRIRTFPLSDALRTIHDHPSSVNKTQDV